MNRLATFVHVSDLHFGDADPDTGNSVIGSQPPWWDSCHIFNGFLGHYRKALAQFQEIFDNLRGENPLFLVTGDLTAFAHDDAADNTRNQFQIAKSYISSFWEIGQLDPVGLNLGPARDHKLDHTVPGNHDYWGGGNGTALQALVNGGPVGAFGQIFRKSPFIERYPLAPGLPDVLFIGIDSDAGVTQADLLFARGILTRQIPTVRNMIPRKADPPEIRVLLMHHSPMYCDPTGTGMLSLDHASKTALDSFVDDYQISVMLTGHIHVPNAMVKGTDKSGRKVLEARSGTTTVRDHVPAGWDPLGAAPGDQLPPNTFLVHRLLGNQDAAGKINSISWQTSLYARTVAGFALSQSPPQGLLADMPVWP